MTKQYCPLMTLAFEAPKDSKAYDPRTCKSDCAWYNKDDKACVLHSINSNIIDLMEYICATSYGVPFESVEDAYAL